MGEEKNIDYNQKFIELDRASFIELTLPLCYWVINNKFSNVSNLAQQLDMEVEDVYQEAQLGLMYAYNTFKPELNVKWNTYAVTCIQQNIFNKLRFRKERNKFASGFTSLDEQVHLSDNNLQVSDLVGREDEGLKNIPEDDFKNYIFDRLFLNLKPNEKRTLELIRTYENVSQNQLSKMLGVKQPQVSRIIKYIVDKGKRIAEIA